MNTLDTIQPDAPIRALLRYHGGKWQLAPWIISHFPRHTVYVEPYGGAGSVLIAKARAPAEIYNDLDGEIVNFFRVARDNGAELADRVALTPYSREEFNLSFLPSEDPIERARRTVIRSFMGFGSNMTRPNRDHSPQRTGWRWQSQRNGRWYTPAGAWANWPDAMSAIIHRLRGVVIDHADALDVIARTDREGALHYVDPPYVHSTRGASCGGSIRAYRHEMTDDQHRALAALLNKCKGAVIVSGYACDLYDRELFPDWQRVSKHTHADDASPRTETLWLRNVQLERNLPGIL